MAPKLSRCALPMRDACDESGRDHMMTVTTWEYILSVRLRHDTLVSRTAANTLDVKGGLNEY